MNNKSDYKKKAVELHKKLKGKISVCSKATVSKNNLNLLYTPGVAEPCKIIQRNEDKSYELTSRANMIAVITDGSAVLGLGNIGNIAGMPVMEGKCILFKAFAGVDAFPLCINTQNVNKIVETICMLEPSFGGINLEDISAPRCFEIERKLKEKMSIPVFHDDQHGTAVVVLAGLINVLRLTNRTVEHTKVVVNGAGAAGLAVTKFLLSYGFKNIIICDRNGILPKKFSFRMNEEKFITARKTNPLNVKGTLTDALKDADVFIGLSVKNVLKAGMLKKMNKDAIVFALANPDPEIKHGIAKKCGIKYIATGRSDFPNQINNVLAFPGIMRGALAVRAKDINEEMKIAASIAIAAMIPEKKLRADYFIPNADDLSIGPKVAGAVTYAAIKTKVNRIKKDPAQVEKETKAMIKAVSDCSSHLNAHCDTG
ncbi:NADP-dependent malic enzyme [bacterium]